MEFWGVEVKPGHPLTVKPDVNKLIHISQAALGEVKNDKGADSVPLRLKVDTGKFVIGALSAENTPQLMFDLVFEREFELSHDWKNGSVYFCGYIAENPFVENEDDSDSDSDEGFPVAAPENGKLEVVEAKPPKFKAAVKPESSTKPKVTPVEPKKDGDSDDEDDDDDEADWDSSSVPIEDSDDSMDLDDESDDDDDEDEDEETPKKAVPAKKRPAESATKTPVSAKKAKSDSPQKTDGKKGGGHTATPHASKKAGKTPVNSNKSKEQTPKSSGQVSCKSCSKTFNSDVALQSHTKAKHDGK